jgi:hypothetical protein
LTATQISEKILRPVIEDSLHFSPGFDADLIFFYADFGEIPKMKGEIAAFIPSGFLLLSGAP